MFEHLLSSGASAKALVPTDETLGLDWVRSGFDDSAWTTGTTGVGYDLGTSFGPQLGLNLDAPPDGQPPIPVQNVNQSVYVRIPFQVDSPESDTLTLKMKYDDGFVAYLNGVEVAHANAPGPFGSGSGTVGAVGRKENFCTRKLLESDT